MRYVQACAEDVNRTPRERVYALRHGMTLELGLPVHLLEYGRRVSDLAVFSVDIEVAEQLRDLLNNVWWPEESPPDEP